jgi:DNA-directed RNA polymerase specialized sigma24 family protein
MMTREDVINYITRLDGKLRTMYVDTIDDDDYYQFACLALIEDHAKLTAENDDQFCALLYTYLDTRRRQVLSNNAAAAELGTLPLYIEDHLNERGEPINAAKGWTVNPWNTPRIKAIEYIELLPHAYRQVFVPLFIEGLEESEVAAHLGITQPRVSQMVVDGVQWIRDELNGTH